MSESESFFPGSSLTYEARKNWAFALTYHHRLGREVPPQAATFRASYYLRIEVDFLLPTERPENALRSIAITSDDFCCRKITLDCSESLSMKVTADHLALVGSLLC